MAMEMHYENYLDLIIMKLIMKPCELIMKSRELEMHYENYLGLII